MQRHPPTATQAQSLVWQRRSRDRTREWAHTAILSVAVSISRPPCPLLSGADHSIGSSVFSASFSGRPPHLAHATLCAACRIRRRRVCWGLSTAPVLSVLGVLQRAVGVIGGPHSTTTGWGVASRTDAGVHADDNIVHFDWQRRHGTTAAPLAPLPPRQPCLATALRRFGTVGERRRGRTPDVERPRAGDGQAIRVPHRDASCWADDAGWHVVGNGVVPAAAGETRVGGVVSAGLRRHGTSCRGAGGTARLCFLSLHRLPSDVDREDGVTVDGAGAVAATAGVDGRRGRGVAIHRRHAAGERHGGGRRLPVPTGALRMKGGGCMGLSGLLVGTRVWRHTSGQAASCIHSATTSHAQSQWSVVTGKRDACATPSSSQPPSPFLLCSHRLPLAAGAEHGGGAGVCWALRLQ